MSANGQGAEGEAKSVETCATCGRPLTQIGPKGECLRCLVGLSVSDDSQQPEAFESGRRLTPAPLKYDHFEVEVGEDGFPVELGAGAMATTYRARDTVLNSVVALKVIDQKVAQTPGARSRFLREARAAAQIRHPNVARVSHFGEQDGECFYVMELVEGETLEAKVRREGPLPLASALEIVERVARALAAAEACGVVHRDIKPSNIMLEYDPGGTPIVKVIDYGVAKVVTPDVQPGDFQTQAGFIGTPAFASPEQFAPPNQTRIDARSDIYSLGVTFWYLLSGRVPFVGPTMEAIHGRQTECLPFEQLKGLHVPGPCLALLQSMLTVDPAQRPQSARELLTDVHRCYVRFEPSARRRRKRLALTSASLAVGMGLVVLAIFTYFRPRHSPELDRAIAILPFENLSANADDRFLAIGLQDEIVTKLASLADVRVISRASTQRFESKPSDLNIVARQLGVGRVLQGSLQRVAERIRVNVQLIDTRTDTHLWASTYNREMKDILEVESEVASAIAQQLNAKLTRFAQETIVDKPTQSDAAYRAYLRGLGIERDQFGDTSNQEAASAYANAVQLDPSFAVAWARLSLIRSYFYFNGVDKSPGVATEIKEAADRALALRPDLGEAWLAQGAYRYRILRDFSGALQAYEEAEKRLPNSALVNEYMAYVERRLGRWKEAETHYLKAAELDPRDYRLWRSIADELFNHLQRFPEAQAALDRALEISPNDESAITAKADVFQQEGRLNEAAKELARLPRDSTNNYSMLIRALQAMFERQFDTAILWTEEITKDLKAGEPINTSKVVALTYQGYCQEWAGRPDEARSTFERIVQAIAPTPGSKITLESRGTRSLLAMAYAGLGEREKASREAKQAVADYESDAAVKPSAELWFAIVQARFGDSDSAFATLRRLLDVPGGVTLGELRFSPFWDPVRNHAGFQRLLADKESVGPGK